MPSADTCAHGHHSWGRTPGSHTDEDGAEAGGADPLECCAQFYVIPRRLVNCIIDYTGDSPVGSVSYVYLIFVCAVQLAGS